MVENVCGLNIKGYLLFPSASSHFMCTKAYNPSVANTGTAEQLKHTCFFERG